MFGGTSKRRKAKPFRLNPWLHGIRQTVKHLNDESFESLETHWRGGVTLEVERKRTRAGVPDPVLHGFGRRSRLLAKSHATHDPALSLCESHPATKPRVRYTCTYQYLG